MTWGPLHYITMIILEEVELREIRPNSKTEKYKSQHYNLREKKIFPILNGDAMKKIIPWTFLFLSCFFTFVIPTSSFGSGNAALPSIISLLLLSDEDQISSQLVKETNWRIMQTYDQTDINVSASLSADRSESLMANSLSGSGAAYEPQSLGDITTYTATGLVSEHFDKLYVDADYLVVGSLGDGFSQIKVIDIGDPKGKVYNYRGRNTGNASDRFGCSGFTKRSSDNKIYAWYGLDIIDVSSKEIVFSSAPDYTHGGYGCGPKDRFVADEDGNFWIGTENVDVNGEFVDDGTGFSNGLSKIPSDFVGEREVVISDLAVWNIFKGTDGTIWIGGNKGIYRRMPSGVPSPVYNSIATGHFPEQIFEYSGDIYAIIKNFFHNPSLVVGNRTFELFKWNEGNSQFEEVCDILNDSYTTGVYAFSYDGSLYVARSGNSSPYKFNQESSSFTQVASIGDAMGQYAIAARGNVLYSTGNISGVSIYNYDGGEKTKSLTPANTAEALITDNTHSLYCASDNSVFVGPEASGFNIVDNDQFEIYELPNEVIAVGFFEYGGNPFVQGASNLYRMESDVLSNVIRFPTNGEEIYYDSNGHLWTFPNWGAGYGGIAVLDLSTLTIKGSRDDYWNTTETWTLDRSYHFHDIISIPGEDAVFIAVGDSEITYPIPNMAYVLKYSYASNTFTKVNLPDPNSQGIRVFATNGTDLYGIGRQKLFIYREGAWDYFCDIKLGNDFRGAKIVKNDMVIISGWNSNGDGLSGGIEVVNLNKKTSVHYDTSQIPIPTDAVFAIEIQDFGSNHFRLWLGTFNGLAYCNLVLNDDHGDDCDNGTAIGINSTTGGDIEVSGDTDCFVVEAPSYGIMTAYTTGNLDTWGALGELDGSWGSSRPSGGPGDNFLVTRAIDTPGASCCVKVEGEGGNTGAYVLNVDFKRCTDANPIALNSTVEKNWAVGGCDFYSIVIPDEGGTLGTLTVYTEGETDTRGNLRRPDCSPWMGVSGGGDGNNFRIEAVNIDPGTYYLGVSYPETGQGDGGTYTLHIEFD